MSDKINAKNVLSEYISWLGDETKRMMDLEQRYRDAEDSTGTVYCKGAVDAHNAAVKKIRELLDSDDEA